MTLGGKSSGLREAQRLAVGIARCLIRWKKRHVSGLDSPASPLEAWGFLLPAGLFCALRPGDALAATLNVWGWIIRGAGKRTAFLQLPGSQGRFRTRLQRELALCCQQIFEPDSLKFRNIRHQLLVIRITSKPTGAMLVMLWTTGDLRYQKSSKQFVEFALAAKPLRGRAVKGDGSFPRRFGQVAANPDRRFSRLQIGVWFF